MYQVVFCPEDLTEKGAGSTPPHGTYPAVQTTAPPNRGALHFRAGWGARGHGWPVWGQEGPSVQPLTPGWMAWNGEKRQGQVIWA